MLICHSAYAPSVILNKVLELQVAVNTVVCRTEQQFTAVDMKA